MSDPTASTSTSAQVFPSSLELTPEIMQTFKPSKVFKNHNEDNKSFTSLSFDDKGDFVITSAEDETLQLFNCRTGKHQKQLHSKKYGVHLARFTHKNTAIIHASTKEDDGIRYLSLQDNSYQRYFKGHKKRVVSLEMSPSDDTFLSGATDDTVRLWDLRTQNAQGMVNIAGQPCVAYDPAGTVFAVALNLRSTLLLYDLKNFDKAPFLNVKIEDTILEERSFPPRYPIFTSLKFSNDGKYLLVGTSGDTHYVVDAFEGNVVARLEVSESNPTSGLERDTTNPYIRPMESQTGLSGEEVTWSPDGRYVLSGSIDGRIHIWDVAPPENSKAYSSRPPKGPKCTLYPLRSLEGHQGGPSRAVAFNPKSAMFVSAGNDLAFWLPDNTDPAFPRTESN